LPTHYTTVRNLRHNDCRTRLPADRSFLPNYGFPAKYRSRAGAYSDALRHLRSGSPSLTLNCGCGHGSSVLEVVETVKRLSGVDFKAEIAPRREGDPARIVANSQQAQTTSAGSRASTILQPLSRTPSSGNAR
jgi:hypothetical protein